MHLSCKMLMLTEGFSNHDASSLIAFLGRSSYDWKDDFDIASVAQPRQESRPPDTDGPLSTDSRIGHSYGAALVAEL
jgi:hypothetical protein